LLLILDICNKKKNEKDNKLNNLERTKEQKADIVRNNGEIITNLRGQMNRSNERVTTLRNNLNNKNSEYRNAERNVFEMREEVKNKWYRLNYISRDLDHLQQTARIEPQRNQNQNNVNIQQR